jgi:hypothetical protein
MPPARVKPHAAHLPSRRDRSTMERMENDTALLDDALPVQDGASDGGFAEGGRTAITPLVARGAARHLRALGFAVVSELILANGRRADLAALGPRGEVWIVEVKSCIEDFRADRKWPDYRLFCDRLLFAVGPAFPQDILPEDAGLMIADAYGASLMREGLHHPLSGAARKSLTIRFAQAAALRLHAMHDPDLFGAMRTG